MKFGQYYWYNIGVDAKGDITINDGDAIWYARITFSGTNNQNLSVDPEVSFGGAYEKITINKSSRSVILGNNITVTGGWDSSSGAFYLQNSTLDLNSHTVTLYQRPYLQSGATVKDLGTLIATVGDSEIIGGSFTNNPGLVLNPAIVYLKIKGNMYCNLTFTKTYVSNNIIHLHNSFIIEGDLRIK